MRAKAPRSRECSHESPDIDRVHHIQAPPPQPALTNPAQALRTMSGLPPFSNHERRPAKCRPHTPLARSVPAKEPRGWPVRLAHGSGGGSLLLGSLSNRRAIVTQSEWSSNRARVCHLVTVILERWRHRYQQTGRYGQAPFLCRSVRPLLIRLWRSVLASKTS